VTTSRAKNVESYDRTWDGHGNGVKARFRAIIIRVVSRAGFGPKFDQSFVPNSGPKYTEFTNKRSLFLTFK